MFVVDDEKVIANGLSFVLREQGLDVETFYDALSALLRTSECLPDTVVTDISMTGMDGITLARALRKQNSQCKILFISGNPDWKTHADLQGDGLDGYRLLLKPFSLREFVSLVNSEQG